MTPPSLARPWRVLFLCTANSARSILAEALLTRRGDGRFIAHSAGSQPRGTVNPAALALLTAEGFEVSGFRSKSWDVFAGPGAPAFDLIVTVCDNAAGEVCPVWPGHPARAHWGVPDPAGQPDEPAAFARAYRQLGARIGAFTALPFDRLDEAALAAELQAIGAMPI